MLKCFMYMTRIRKLTGAIRKFCCSHWVQGFIVCLAVAFAFQAMYTPIQNAKYGKLIHTRISEEIRTNADILLRKMRIADNFLKQLVEMEELISEAPPHLLLPDPYRELGPRLRRDVMGQSFKREAYNDLLSNATRVSPTFLEKCRIVYSCFDTVERDEELRITMITRIYETWEAIGIAAIYGVPIFRKTLGGLVGSYWLYYDQLREKSEGIVRDLNLPLPPSDLFWFEYLVEQRESSSQEEE